MTHILNITPASALCSPTGRAESAKGTGNEGGNDFCLQIDQADAGVAFVCGALHSQAAPCAVWGGQQLCCSLLQNSDVLYGV